MQVLLLEVVFALLFQMTVLFGFTIFWVVELPAVLLLIKWKQMHVFFARRTRLRLQKNAFFGEDYVLKSLH